MSRIKNISGQKFNSLTAISYVETKRNAAYWKFKCECGNEIVRAANLVKTEGIKSCGCKSGRGLYSGIRNKYKSEYHTWCLLRARCNNPDNPKYPNYGGRGITYVERWKNFHNFIEDMGMKPGENYTIDRIDNEGN